MRPTITVETKKALFPFKRLVHIALALFDEMEFSELVSVVSELTRDYYHDYKPPDDSLRVRISKTLRIFQTRGLARRVKRGKWRITWEGLSDLTRYHLNVKRIPEEILPYDVKWLAERMIERQNKRPPFWMWLV